VNFWICETNRHKKKQKIVLLEDAEDLLLPREGSSRDRVSNLLNLADGLLGDHLKIQVIATTNEKVRELDPAILRPGRLMGSREFRRLNRNEAQRLATAKQLVLPE
jgi:SpoVK/Ycf46/Vps4 family AAA+-type ATPase